MADKFNDIFKMFDNIFGKNFGKDFNQSPEEFMSGSEYSKTEENGTDEEGNSFTKTTYTSKDGKRKFTRMTSSGNGQFNRHKSTNATNPNKSQQENRLYTLEHELPIAIEKEEFEKAIKIRDEIAKIKTELKKAKAK